MHIVLCRGTSYAADGIVFDLNIPRVVDDDLGQRLVRTRRFRIVDADEAARLLANRPAEEVLDGMVQATAAPKMPVNYIGLDNLNGKKVLLKRIGAIGDIVFVAQFARHLKQQFPGVIIALCVPVKYEDFASLYAHVDYIVEPNDAAKHEVITQFDYLVDFSGVIESHGRVPADCFKAHFERAGTPIDTNGQTWQAPECSIAKNTDAYANAYLQVSTLLQEHKIDISNYIVVLRGTSNSLKTWDGKILKRLLDKLASVPVQQRMPVILLGTSKDKIKTRFHDIPFVVDSMDLPLVASALLVTHARAVIGGDTGLLHFAHSVGVPTVSYWCSTSPDFVRPRLDSKIHAFVESKSSCHPCNVLRSVMCPHYSAGASDCTRKLDADELVQALQSLVGRVPQPNPMESLTSGRSLSVDEARALYNGNQFNVAFVVDSFNVWSGGAFYTWTLARSFAKRAHSRVWVLTSDRQCVFMQSIPPLPNMVVVYDPNRDMLTHPDKKLFFSVAIGTPHKGGMDAVHYAQTTPGTKSACLIYETPNYVAQYRSGRDSQEAFWKNYAEAMAKADMVFTISQVVKRYLAMWQPDLRLKTEVVSPSIASSVADTICNTYKYNANGTKQFVPNQDRDDLIVLISRNVSYKGMQDVLPIIAQQFAPVHFSTSRVLTIAIIGNNSRFLYTTQMEEWAKMGVRVVFYEAIDEPTKWQLLSRAKAVLHPSTFEGFGIPLAEAMYAGTPVIAHRLPVFEEAFAQHPFYYATPDELVKTLTSIFVAWDLPESDPGRAKIKLNDYLLDARLHVTRRYSEEQQYSRICMMFVRFFKDMELSAQRTSVEVESGKGNMRVAMVTPWNVRCGVGETTRQLLDAMPCTYRIFAPYELPEHLIEEDTQIVTRCFSRDFKVSGKLMNELLQYAPTVVHIQHEFSIFKDSNELLRLINRLRERNIKVVVTMHTLTDSLFIQQLAGNADLLIATRDSPVNPPNTQVVPLPIATPKTTADDRNAIRTELGIGEDTFVFGAFGMWQPFKGFAAFVDTYMDVAQSSNRPVKYLVSGFAKEKDMYFRNVIRQHQGLINSNSIILLRDYAPLDTVHRRIAACDAMVYYYDHMQHYSASASVREAFALARPALCSDVAMFSEFEHGTQVFKVEKQQNETGVSQVLIDGLIHLQRDKDMLLTLSKFGALYTSQCRARIIAQRLAKFYQQL